MCYNFYKVVNYSVLNWGTILLYKLSKMDEVKGILIDSGRVLNVSATGSWSYSPKFFEIVGKNKFYNISNEKREDAYSKAWNYINSINLMATIQEEREHFSKFFSILAEELPELEIDENKKNLLIDDFDFNFDKYTFFKDVYDVLPKLSERYKLCLVSDAWPSLRGVYKKAGLDKYFNSMIISTELGVTKPSEEIYKAALVKLGLSENEVIFIDDNPKNCDGAAKLGIRSLILSRSLWFRLYSKFILKTRHKIVKDLYEVDNLF